MKKIGVSALSVFLTLCIILGLFASCASGGEGETSGIELDTNEATESASTSEGASTGEVESSSESESDSDTEGEVDTIELEGEHASLISHAYLLKNNVSAYFPTKDRDSFIYENMNMILDYALDASMPQQVTSLKNKAGNVYVENTMDVFVEMADGSRYFAKNSHTDGVPNIYRLGYYFYEMRVEGQSFMQNMNGVDSTEINHLNISAKNEIKGAKKNSGALRNRQECKSDYYQNVDGTYTVFLKILAPVQPMLELKFVVPDKKTAQNIYKNWECKASDLYSAIYETLVD